MSTHNMICFCGEISNYQYFWIEKYILSRAMVLTFTTVSAKSANEKLITFFFIFPRKQDLTFHANCFH